MIKNNACYAPFLGSPVQKSIGLNPLGMRTASEQYFTTLLPGMNVVTGRIRYYSFYCWLLQRFYASREQATVTDFQRHIRMSELLMALINVACGQGDGVPGNRRASSILAHEGEEIDFRQDAMPDGKAAGGYWNGPNGILGSYYVVALQEFNLIKQLQDDERLYNITPRNDGEISGEELAGAFAETVSPVADLFESCAQSGRVKRTELQKMAPYFQTHTMEKTRERELLLHLLLQADYPNEAASAHLRRGTLRLLLRFWQDEKPDSLSETDFAQFVYYRFAHGLDHSTEAMGWYAYHLNDHRQYESLRIFNALLSLLTHSDAPGQWEDIASLTAKLAKTVAEALNCSGLTLREALLRWTSIAPPEQEMAQAFYYLLDDYRRNKGFRDAQSRIKEAGFSVSDDALAAFSNLEKHHDEPVELYFQRFLTEDIIYNHYAEAMRKYSMTGVATHKLIIENGRVKGLGTYDPSHSTPRIGTLYQFATDLGLVKAAGLTRQGIEILKLLENDCA